MSALSIVLAVFVGSYYYLKHTRWKHSNIKGYLDLIPDLTGDQRQKSSKYPKDLSSQG